MVNRGDRLAPRLREEEAAVAELRFAYPAGAAREPAEERRAQYLLESLGVLELACLDQVSVCPGSTADYMVRADGDVHALCSFTAYAVPQLRALGWRVDLSPDYPFQVVERGRLLVRARRARRRAAGLVQPRARASRSTAGGSTCCRRCSTCSSRLPAAGRLERSARCRARAASRCRWARTATSAGAAGAAAHPAEGAARAVRRGRARRCASRRTRAGALAPAGRRLREAPRRRPAGCAGRAPRRELGSRARAGRRAAPRRRAPGGCAPALRPYQEEGLRWLQHLRAHDAGGVLADDMGLGKTLQTIAHLVRREAGGPPRSRPRWSSRRPASSATGGASSRGSPRTCASPLLHGAERHALPWAQIARATSSSPPTRCSCATRRCSRARRSHLAGPRRGAGDQEPAQPGPRAAARALERRHRLCLSGTPVENHLGELWALFDFLDPGLLGDADWFRHRFAVPIERDGEPRAPGSAARRRWRRSSCAAPRRRSRASCRPRPRSCARSSCSGAQRELYESIRVAAHAEVRQAIASKGLAGSTITILDALMKLRQVCCDPRLRAAARPRASVRESAKLRAADRAGRASSSRRAGACSCSRSSPACSR